MTKVILIFGGESSEHEVSCKSAQFIYDYIDAKRYKLMPIGISKTGRWYFYDGDDFVNWEDSEQLFEVTNIIDTLKNCDVVFPIIHGKYGEDGHLQSLLELFHISYVGCDSKTSMLCMDKEYMKILAQHYNIPIVPYEVIRLRDLRKKREYPVIVKPANGGSSIGISVAHNKKELKYAYEEALKYDNKVISEDYLKVRELEVAVLTNGNTYYMSNIGEILTDGELYDYNNKYVSSKDTIVKSKLPKKVEKRINRLVDKLVQIFNIEGMSRIDFFYDEKLDLIYFNEINTIPGFTEISMYPKLLKNCKIEYQKLISKLLENC